MANTSQPSTTQGGLPEQSNGGSTSLRRDGPTCATATESRPAPKLIAVFGRTGTGKTSFIEDVSGQKQGVGHNLTSCKLQSQEDFN
jgi:Cdc6-like AAA superfamily ATPase